MARRRIFRKLLAASGQQATRATKDKKVKQTKQGVNKVKSGEMCRSAGQIRGRSSGQIGQIGQIGRIGRIGRTLDGANTTKLHITLLPCMIPCTLPCHSSQFSIHNNSTILPSPGQCPVSHSTTDSRQRVRVPPCPYHGRDSSVSWMARFPYFTDAAQLP